VNLRNLSLLFILVLHSTTWGSSPSTSAKNEKSSIKTSESKSFLLTLKPGSSQIKFEAVGRPSALKIHGTGTDLIGSFNLVGQTLKADLSFKPESLETGISLRDKHMKEKYLEVEKFPEIKFRIQDAQVPASFFQDNYLGEELPINGILTLHGVEKPIIAKMRLEKKANVTLVKTQFSLKVTDYGIEIPKFANVTMAEDVNVSTDFELNTEIKENGK